MRFGEQKLLRKYEGVGVNWHFFLPLLYVFKDWMQIYTNSDFMDSLIMKENANILCAFKELKNKHFDK